MTPLNVLESDKVRSLTAQSFGLRINNPGSE